MHKSFINFRYTGLESILSHLPLVFSVNLLLLNIGLTSAVLKHSGKIPTATQLLYSSVITGVKTLLNLLMCLVETSFNRGTFLAFNFLRFL